MKFTIDIKKFNIEVNSEDELKEKLSKLGILFNTHLDISVKEYQDITVDEITNEKITMRNLKKYFNTSNKNQILFRDDIDWPAICKKYILSEGVIRAFDSKIDFNEIACRVNNGDYYKFTKDFIADYGCIFDTYNPFSHSSKVVIDDEPDIVEDFSGIGRGLTRSVHYVPEELLFGRECIDEVSASPSIESIKNIIKNLFGDELVEYTIIDKNGNVIDEGTSDDNTELSEQELTEKHGDIYNTPLTPDNFATITLMSEDMMDEYFMSNSDTREDLSINCILTKEFIFKYEKYISFKDLMKNKKCFTKLMMDEEFFDRYIERITKIKNTQAKVTPLSDYINKKNLDM